ncbi:hypothetical protein [Archangium lansingense]|uniref:Type VI secretion system baseplate subunit TssG n=1 Tax=Archangium lansingense TaxID=2995310 RepID=A0ABT4A0G8_9BACT|nr:hypothetical protein [Archangium lansinium]MCY1075151.1 hypothetical protein [Archangium lansinium]
MAGPSLEERIRERIHLFDIPALLELLAHSGYGDAEFEYRSLRTHVHKGHLVHDIQFLTEKDERGRERKRVIITVNVGLLSVQSLLPSFMLRTLDQQQDGRMEDFLRFFDHELLRARFAGLYPNRDETLLPGWEKSTTDRLRLLRPTSPSTLHWLFAKVFPETDISVRRQVRRQPIPSRNIRLGASALGDSTAMGGFAQVPTGGLEVSIFCDEPWCGTGKPWAHEAPERLKTRILPLLADTPLLLTVLLVLRDHPNHIRVDDQRTIEDDSYLGYDPLKVGKDDAQRIILFSGNTERQAATTGQAPRRTIRRAS